MGHFEVNRLFVVSKYITQDGFEMDRICIQQFDIPIFRNAQIALVQVTVQNWFTKFWVQIFQEIHHFTTNFDSFNPI